MSTPSRDGRALDPGGMEPPNPTDLGRQVLDHRAQREQLGVGVGAEQDHAPSSARMAS